MFRSLKGQKVEGVKEVEMVKGVEDVKGGRKIVRFSCSKSTERFELFDHAALPPWNSTLLGP